MDCLDGADARFRLALCCYVAALEGVQQHVFEALAGKAGGSPLSLEAEAATLRATPDDLAFENARMKLDSLLCTSSGQIERHLAGVVDLEEVLSMLTSARQSLSKRQESKEEELRAVASTLDEASREDGLDQLRRRIRQEAQRVSVLVQQMHADNQRMLQELDEEMNRYRRRLNDAADSANHDALTGLGNRRLVNDRLAELIDSGTPLCLLMLDFNRFKLINDIHGHLAGDELLRAFAARLRNHLRQDDIAARWGGDEFVIALPCAITDAMARTRLLQQNLSGEYSIRLSGKSLRIQLTVSIGIAEYRPGETVNQLMTRADESLYTHKHR
ncbi:GGDEF domain-containing protein [Paludibaculum fermentans]|uniref:diguanylate cyclase n=1 Tax=Paludibaculum fermentans TaxID=1473598 RepID=A0A7S7NKJ2_PALFE|nr:GGDEF domain-containing protein [Paludibaculum fermentans]QOY85336.1 diguanylate cyclase [Paludibaculum fermentans]